MQYERPLIEATLLQRYKRFLADVRLADGTVVTAHCANSGSMKGLLEEGAPVRLMHHADPKRKLAYSWEQVKVGQGWVVVNTARPNHIVRAAIEAGRIPELSGYDTIEPERKYGENSRIDLLLSKGEARCYVEVKNVTLAEGACAMFPDAVTARGTKHLNELMAVAADGQRAVMVFLVAREDCDRFRPAAAIDPVYAETLALALDAGVEALCYACEVSPEGVVVRRRVPLSLEA